jgi:hypothetical protein
MRRREKSVFPAILLAMNTAEVANQYVALCRNGQYLEALETLYDAEVVSIEPMEVGGMPSELRGKDAVRRKNIWWFDTNVVHSASVNGPFVGPERFAVVFSFEWTVKASGERVQFSEVAVYTVVNGKIIREEFLYGGGA